MLSDRYLLCDKCVRVCNVCMCLLVYSRSELGDLVSRVDGSLSSSDGSGHHQTGAVGLLALCLEGGQQLLQMGDER